MASQYLDLEGFKSLSVMPSEFVDEVEQRYPGWINSQLLAHSGSLDSQLRKRYAAPFQTPYPLTLQLWLARIFTVRCAMRRGISPNDEQFPLYKDDAERAQLQVDAAAESVQAGFDIPVRETSGPSGTGIAKGAPLSSSQQSPYTWRDDQACIGKAEDAQRRFP